MNLLDYWRAMLVVEDQEKELASLKTGDPIVDQVQERIARRSREGMMKYGVTMMRPDTTTVQWLRHAQEEALDLAVYLERVIYDMEHPEEPPHEVF